MYYIYVTCYILCRLKRLVHETAVMVSARSIYTIYAHAHYNSVTQNNILF